MTNNQTSGKAASVGLRVLAVLSFLVVLSVGMWGSVQIAKAVPTAFSTIAAAIASLTSVFIPANSAEEVVVSASALTVPAGTPVTVSWQHVNKREEGSYTFRFNCADGVHFTSNAGGQANAMIFCNIPFNFLNDGNTLVVTPESSKNRFVDATVFIDFTPNGASAPTLTGSLTLTIVNEDLSTSPGTVSPTTPITPAPTTPVTPAPQPPKVTTFPPTTVTAPVSDPNGRVDLAVRVIEVGVVNKTTGVFTASSTPYRNSQEYRIAVRFTIENVGTKTSPNFSFNAVLPTLPSHIFSSPVQQNLNPGDRIEYTLAFDSFVDADEGVFKVNVDPTGSINEPNKENNLVTYTVKVKR